MAEAKKKTKNNSKSSGGAKNPAPASKEAVKVGKGGKTSPKNEHATRSPRPVWRSVMPYLFILFAVILAIFFVTVRLLHMDDGAGIVGYAVQMLFCGFFGGGAFLIPAILLVIGVNWCLYNIKWNGKVRNPSHEDYPTYKKLRKKLLTRSILAFFVTVTLSSLFGVFAAYEKIDVVAMWNHGGHSFVSGGIIGGAIGYLFVLCFSSLVSVILLAFILLALVLLFFGITPEYIITRAQYKRLLRMEERDRIRAEEEELLAAREAEEKEAEYAVRRQGRAVGERASEGGFESVEKTKAAPKKPKNMSADELMDEEYVPADDIVTDEAAPEEKDEIYIGPSLEEIERNKKKNQRRNEFIELDEDKSSDRVEIDQPRDYADDIPYDKSEFDGFDAVVSGMGGASQTENKIDVDELYGDEGENDTESRDNVIELIDGIGENESVATDQPLNLNLIGSEELMSDLNEIKPDEVADSEDEDEADIPTPYVFPPIDMLAENKNNIDDDYSAELQENAKALVDTLKSFKVSIKEITYSRGPTITRYELKPEAGTRVRAIANLVDDIALNLATSGVRIEAPIPNKPAVGIEVPNRERATVYLRDLIENSKFTDSKSKISSCLGMDVGGNPVYFDVAKMPHLLIAGTTGSGKSVCINTIILSILYKARPDEVKLILIDPKQVEFTVYENIPHLYCPIVSEPKKAAGALASAVAEMERRFELIKSVGVRNIEAYNEITANDPDKEYMPKMVIIIDELADLMMTARDEVETSICRLAQKARAAGIHVILGTQRPSVDVITGLIKANVPSRIACTVTSQVDSRTIIDVAGAENLIGYGDMLFAPVGAAKPVRVQGAFVSDPEVEKIVSFIKENNSVVKYNKAFIDSMEENAKLCGMSNKKGGGGAMSQESDMPESEGGDTKFRDAVKLAIEEGKISTSLMQRRLGVGYGRAAKIIDTMEEMGYVSKPDGNKPRRVLITMEEYMRRVVDGNLEAGASDSDE